VDVSKADLARFARYHINLTEKHKLRFRTVIFTLKIPSVTVLDDGQFRFAPTFVLASRKNADTIMMTLRTQIAANDPFNELDLVYLPLYQSGTKTPADLLKEGVMILRSTNLDQQQKQRIALLMLTISNKIVDKQELKNIWEEFYHMTKLVAFEVAEEIGVEKGIEIGVEKGINQGVEQGKIEIAMDMLRGNVQIEMVTQYSKLPQDFINLLKERSGDITLQEAISLYRMNFSGQTVDQLV
jgi:predicted transposase/invertase (TIGR01784 family)